MNAMFLTPATAVVNVLLPSLMALLPDDIMRIGLDKLFDSIEDAIKASPSPIDDALVTPLIAALRAKLNVPDSD